MRNKCQNRLIYLVFLWFSPFPPLREELLSGFQRSTFVALEAKPVMFLVILRVLFRSWTKEMTRNKFFSLGLLPGGWECRGIGLIAQRNLQTHHFYRAACNSTPCCLNEHGTQYFETKSIKILFYSFMSTIFELIAILSYILTHFRWEMNFERQK